MKKFGWYFLLIVLLLLGYSTSIVKFISLDAEVKLFQNAGFTKELIFAFGLLQFIATTLTAIPKTRRYGAIILAITFMIATVVVFISQMIGFGVFSISFILLALIFARIPKLNKV